MNPNPTIPMLDRGDRRIQCSGPSCPEGHTLLLPADVATDAGRLRRHLAAYGLTPHPTDPTAYFCSKACATAPRLCATSIDGGRPEMSALASKYRASVAAQEVQEAARRGKDIAVACKAACGAQQNFPAGTDATRIARTLAASGYLDGFCSASCRARSPRAPDPAPAPFVPASSNESVNRAAALGRQRRGEAAWPGDDELIATLEAARAKAAKAAKVKGAR